MVATIGPPGVTTWVLCLLLSLRLPAHTASVSHLGNEGSSHLLSRICRWLLPENSRSARALPSSSGGAGRDSFSAPHSTVGPSPVRMQGTGPAHCTQARYPPLRTLSCQPSMWANSSQPTPVPGLQARSLTRSGHKRQQRTVAFSISSSVVQRLSNSPATRPKT